MEIVVSDEWLVIYVHLKMPVGPFRVFAATVVPAKIACAARERPLQVLVFDRELDKLATTFICEVIDVLRERPLVRDPTQVVFKLDEAIFLSDQLEMLLAEAIGFEQPVRAWLTQVK